MDASPLERSLFDLWSRRHFGLATGGALATLIGARSQSEVAARKNRHKKKEKHPEKQVKADLEPVDDSGVSGFVTLHQLKNEQGTSIVVHANGLTPDTEYISLYYDNDTCELEPYSAEDVIGGTYFANAAGFGHTHGVADDDLDEIHSVSVRLADDFSLLACAKV
jgi:hypothetical protein